MRASLMCAQIGKELLSGLPNTMILRRFLACFFQRIVRATRYAGNHLDDLMRLSCNRIHGFTLRVQVAGQFFEHARGKR